MKIVNITGKNTFFCKSCNFHTLPSLRAKCPIRSLSRQMRASELDTWLTKMIHYLHGVTKKAYASENQIHSDCKLVSFKVNRTRKTSKFTSYIASYAIEQWPFSQKFLRSIMLVRETLRFCSFSQKFLREYLRVKSVVTLRQF